MNKFYLFLLLITFFSHYSHSQCTQPNYCDRSCWDPSGTHPADNTPSYTTPTHIIIHHSGNNYSSGTNYSSVIRSIWNYHVNTNGWEDIGYNWLIDPNGVLYEGRGDGVRGAHFSGMNSYTMGVCLIGNFQTVNPTTNAINKLEDLIAWEATDKSIDVLTSSYLGSTGLYLRHISGHRDGGSTDCPGDNLYNLIPSIRTAVSNLPCYNGSGSNYPDLVIESMWTTPSNPSVDDNVDLYVEIKNVGTATANSITLNYRINGSIVGSDTHSSLDPNETRIEYLNNYNFSNSGTFNYCVYIGAVTNEQNTANNSYCINVIVDSGGGSEDIFLTNVSVSPTTVSAGSDVTAYATMNYSGNQLDADLPSFNLDYYISTDCNLSNDDIYLEDDISGLGSDDPANDENEVLTIPSNTPSGTYYILFVADADDELNESNENNNIECVQIMVEIPLSVENYNLQKEVILYPNPTKGILNIENEKSNINSLKVYDTNGKLILSKENINNYIDISNIPSGVYIIRLLDDENNKAVYRVIKE